MEAAMIAYETEWHATTGLMGSVENVNKPSQEEEKEILWELARVFQLAQEGNQTAQKSIQLLKHMTRGESYSGVTNQEALQMVNELDMPEEWKRQARDSVSYPVKEEHV